MSKEIDIAVENVKISEACKIVSLVLMDQAKKINSDKGVFPAIMTEIICTLISAHLFSLGESVHKNIPEYIKSITDRAQEIFNDFLEMLGQQEKH